MGVWTQPINGNYSNENRHEVCLPDKAKCFVIFKLDSLWRIVAVACRGPQLSLWFDIYPTGIIRNSNIRSLSAIYYQYPTRIYKLCNIPTSNGTGPRREAKWPLPLIFNSLWQGGASRVSRSWWITWYCLAALTGLSVCSSTRFWNKSEI